jgi:LL-diaminopimelate aminotransferase
VEFNSLSKTYNMAGARIGMVVGNAQVVEALSRIKSNIDSGLPTMLQRTAVTALTGDQAWIAERNRVYQRRRDLLCRAAHREQPIGALVGNQVVFVFGHSAFRRTSGQ